MSLAAIDDNGVMTPPQPDSRANGRDVEVHTPSIRELVTIWTKDDAKDVPVSRRIWYLIACVVTSTFYATWLVWDIGGLTITNYVSDQLLVGNLRFWSGLAMVGLLGCLLDVRWIRWIYPLGSFAFWLMWIAWSIFGSHGSPVSNTAPVVALGVSFSLAALNALVAHWVLRLSIPTLKAEVPEL